MHLTPPSGNRVKLDLQAAICRHKLSLQHCTCRGDSKNFNTAESSLWTYSLVQNLNMCRGVCEHLVYVYKKECGGEGTERQRKAIVLISA